MIAKLIVLVLCGVCCGAGALSVRQQRLQAVHDAARAIEAAAEQDRALWRLRAELATRLEPARLERMLARIAGEDTEAGVRFEPLYRAWPDEHITRPSDSVVLLGEGDGAAEGVVLP